jgi:two-component system, cell cycle response regulator
MSHINQDIQASHKILKLLEEANSYSESIIDRLPGIFLIVNERYEIIRSNIEFADTFGLDYSKILRLNFAQLFRQETWKIFQHHFEYLRDSPQEEGIKFELSVEDLVDSVKNTHHLPTESPFYWHLCKMSFGNNAEGELYTVMGEDISQLRESEKKLLNVFASIPLGILTVNEDGNIEDTYSNYLGYLLDCEHFEGKCFSEVIFEPVWNDLSQDEQDSIGHLLDCFNSSESVYQNYSETLPKQIYFNKGVKDKNGKFLQISYKPVIYDGLVKRLLIIIEDRTSIIKAEQDKKKANLLEKQSKAVYESAIRDPLTGLFTRLYMQDAVLKMLGDHDQKTLKEVSLVLFDVDKFKRFNDTYGHDLGDKVLAQIAGVILAQVRKDDIPVRFGGEELMVFLPADLTSCYSLAERVRKKVEALEIMVNDEVVTVTISGGLAGHKEGEDIDRLIKRADLMLYQAKEKGRNQNIYE